MDSDIIKLGRLVLIPTKTSLDRIASSRYFSFALGLSTFATRTSLPSSRRPLREPVLGQ